MSVATLNITALGPKGDGIAQGRSLLFIDRALPGDVVKARLFKGKDGVMRGEIEQLIKPSPHRQAAECPHYDVCGGCTLQHVKKDFYRQWKQELVAQAFLKQGLKPKVWLPPQFLSAGGRRRATLTATKKKNQVTLGYYRRRSQDVAEIKTCSVADPKLWALKDRLKPFLKELVEEGEAVDFFIQISGSTAEIVITGPLGQEGTPDKKSKEILTKVRQELKLSRIAWRATERDRPEVLASQGALIAEFGEVSVSLPPAAFLQPTMEGEQTLVKAVMKALPEKSHGKLKVADLFSGAGTFSGAMSSKALVDAFEFTPTAVTALGKAGAKNGIKTFRRDLSRNPLRRDELNRYDVVVFDPPRAGCLEQAENLASCKVPILIGVSCNPTTFARDAKVLAKGGYWLQSLQVVDQFVFSHHVEVVGVFTKKKRH